jgi:hypothetical protein
LSMEFAVMVADLPPAGAPRLELDEHPLR